MDKPLDSKEIRNKKIKQLATWSISIGLILIVCFYALKRLAPKAKSKEIFLATVEKGDMMQTLTASGTIIPAFEYTINAPVVTEIKSIILTNGALVEAGSKILELDQEYTTLEYEKLKDELLLKKNNIEKLKLQFDKELKDLDLQNQIKGLQINETDAQIKSQTRLKNVGGAAAEDIEKVKLQLDIMEIEKKVLENELTYKRKINVVEKDNLELEYGIQVKRLTELRRKLSETTVTADKSGVITWINENIGKTVQVGEPLVRIADLESYRVEAVTSERNIQWLKVGTPVRIRVNNIDLNGTISHTLPSIENNTVKFHIVLEKPDHEALRPNQRTDVHIITSEKNNTLRLKIGPGVTSGISQDFFVVKNGIATKVKVNKGMNNPDYVEILSGLQEGEQVIISNTEKYKNLSQFKIEQ
jgi:HlyD family secretion protein